ncbi:MAG TPA: glycosyltransferase [Casimicrobiaceae bacterium]|nr:glycosyltransferase [Casimicrobiaceae bacterium]
MARSIYEAFGQFHFDVVDTPDYRQAGLFVRQAFARHGIGVGRVALAMHGTLSSAFRLGWPWNDDPARQFAALRMREHLQFRAADCRYALSEFYADEFKQYSRLPINMLDPLAVIRRPKLALSEAKDHPADLAFVGRRERRKGPDLFVDFAWWVPREKYRRLMLLGGDGLNHQRRGSAAIVEAMAHRRELSIDSTPSFAQRDLRALSHSKTVVCLPSRYDQFNLVGLETLLDGCPTVISRRAGIAGYIEKALPALSWLLIDITCDRSAAGVIDGILSDYDGCRKSVAEAIQRADLKPNFQSIENIYDQSHVVDTAARRAMHDLADRFALFSIRGAIKPVATPQTLFQRLAKYVDQTLNRLSESRLGVAVDRWRNKLSAWLQTLRMSWRGGAALQAWSDALVQRLIRMVLNADKTATEFFNLLWRRSIRQNIVIWSERSSAERLNKLRYLTDIISNRRTDRVRQFREMMRLEHLRGNDLIAATYGLRIIRWLGGDDFQLLPLIKKTLVQHGYAREAEAAEVMYGDPAKAEIKSRAFLDDQLQRHRTKPKLPLDNLDDRRGNANPKVSVIVSLYNAEDKFLTFLRMLRQQTIIQSGQLEVVFVDSGSPTREYQQFQSAWSEAPFPAVFARSKDRETIQAAWNRGLHLARGEYVAFLGVDEGIRPDCLQILATELDQNPEIDWVIANSIVTSVDRHGVFDHDIMVYDRTGYRQDWAYLDSTFLSYVGGLYRRNIHRLGYYDETFRAAGDTEFKNRILPYIKSKHVPKPLGVFNNYPDGQTTHHPRAEIEDLRAWYLHRSVAGVSYAFNQRPTEDLIAMLQDTLGYRKCYTQHLSTDIDLAESLSIQLSRRPDGGQWKDAHSTTAKMLDLYRALELLPNNDTLLDPYSFLRDCLKIRRLRKRYKGSQSSNRSLAYDVFNDNRYEQHWWSWSN